MKALKLALLLILAVVLAACDGSPNQTAGPELPEPTTAEASQPETGPAEPASAEPASAEPASDATPTQPLVEAAGPPEPQELSIEGAEGLLIQGTFYPGRGNGPRPGVLLLHVNGGNRGDWQQFAGQLADNGFAALAIDMRGHGETGGGSDWELAAEDLTRVWTALAKRPDVDEANTAIIGASIGANMALATAVSEPDIKTVVLLSPGLDYFGVTTDDRIVEYSPRPALIVASEEDDQAARSSRALHELAGETSSLIMYDGAGHGTTMLQRRPELAGEILSWLSRYIGADSLVASDASGGSQAAGLFDIDWDDRSPYRLGLISAEAGVLDQLPGASVYHIDMSIAADLQSVSARQAVRYTNQEDVPLAEVYFHLFPNLLGGNIDVSAVTVGGQPAAAKTKMQDSILHVPLSEPLAPGESAVIGMDYQVVIPTEGGSNYGVFATIDGVLALAHFYPMIAVYDDEGWNIELPPPNADVTYGDSSFFLVQITAPEEQVLVTSGSQVAHSTDAGQQVLFVAAGPVRDFYLASSDRYTVISQQVGETKVNSYGFPEFNTQNKQALAYSVGALESLGARLGAYPFTEFDVAPTPNLALGVEYPGATVIRAELYDPEVQFNNTPANALMEGTVAHEVGHQWFYSVVGNDQLDEPWVDEALVQYVTYLYFLDTYGPQGAEGFRQSFVNRWQRVNMADIPVGMPAGNYDGTEYGAIVYGRGPLFFLALAEEMGQASFDTFLRDYYQQHKWGIASGADLKAQAEEQCDCDLSALFAEWVGDL
ncbi:MAG: alpha/beta fold hydrolase [Candidatus Promineifilaceae bacterium]